MNEAERALSVQQPWAELILLGRKTIELRTWETGYRGPVWLHTGRSANPDLDRAFGVQDPPRGGFVGRIELLEISPIDARRWEHWQDQHLDSALYRPGLFAWHLASAERLQPAVPAPGRRGLFTVEAELACRLHTALA